jgi:phosphatidylethanolamine/phosphatidyl-N-methylethanolamine N-methyltransferase
MNSTTVKRVYDNYANYYDLIFSRVLDDGRRKAIAEMGIKPDEKIIEIGIGSGLSFKHYNNSQPDFSITGIDISAKMLEKAKKKASVFSNLKIDLRLLNGEETPFEDSTFDKVVLMYVYSVTPDPIKLLKESLRICKDSGSVHIINHFSNYSGKGLSLSEKLLSHYSDRIGFRSQFSYSEYITGLGLEIASVKSANLFDLTRIIHLQKAQNTHILTKKADENQTPDHL